MVALKTLGIFCIILACIGPVLVSVVEEIQKPMPSRLNKKSKRELKINQISYWEYLIIILPLSLLLIGLLSNDEEEKITSLAILGICYPLLLLSSYNNRIGIRWVNNTVLITCLTLAIVSFLLPIISPSLIYQSFPTWLNILWLPMITYVYLKTIREIINVITNTYPLTLDKEFRVGNFSYRYNRKANYWDLTWTLWNILVYMVGAVIGLMKIMT